MKNPIICLLLLLSLGVQAQKKKPNSTINEATKPVLDTVFKNLQWRNIGPTRGGRANAISGVINNSKKFYTGYTGGGVWETKDGGIKWKNICIDFARRAKSMSHSPTSKVKEKQRR
jgi:hypothetical protein